MPIRVAIASLTAVLSLAPALAGPCPAAETCSKDGGVALEVRFITIAEDFFERIGVDFSSGKKVDVVDKGEELRKLLDNAGKEPIFLNEDQAGKFLQAVEGDVRTNIMHAPKLIVSDGKEGSVRCTEQQFFVTGIHAVRQGEQLAMCPKTETFSTGFELEVQPTILKDKHAVAVKVKTGLTCLDGEKPSLFPVVVPVTPVGKDGKAQQPVVFTQFLQQPRLTTLSMQGELTIPDGRSVLLGGWKRLSEGRVEYGPPVLSKVPYVNRLFKNVGYTKATENVLVMVTARIVPHEDKETAKASPACEKRIAELMKQFNEFFRLGKYREAEACALRAHELAPEDPMPCAAIKITRAQQEKVASACGMGGSSCSAISPCSATEKTADSPPPKWVKKMKLLLASYHQACADGRLDEARKLAQQALAIDATCFDEHSVFRDFDSRPSRPHR
jgi:Flp pilus assembly secretin CpaC